VAIATVDDIASGIASGLVYPFLKILTAAKAVGSFQSAWMGTGYPGAGVASPAYTAGAGYTCDRTTAGALGQTNGAVQNWIGKIAAASTVACSILVYDRLWSCSGMGFALGAKAVTTPGALPARITDSGVGVRAFVEQFVAAGAATGTLTLTYVNTAAAAGRTGVIPVVVSAPVAGQLQPIPLQVGDVGVSQVTSANNSATWTSGSFGITLMKPIAVIPCAVAGLASSFDWAQVLRKIPADACVQFAIMATATTAATLFGEAIIIDK